MAAPPDASLSLPPLPHPEPPAPLYFDFNEPPLLPPFMATSNDGLSTGQNHDRHNDTVPLPPPPIPSQDHVPPANTSGEGGRSHSTSSQERQSESGDGSGSENSDSEEEEEQQRQHSQWIPIEEDKSVPCEDELTYISSKEEHSALDHTYWEKKAFFDLEDPEIMPGESGRIDWLVEHFNGTKEEPNTEYMMRSPTMRIGGYDWRIKFYPKGNNTDYLSVYLECVTMQSLDFEESEAFSNPPLPFITGMEKLKKRRFVAAQLCVVMYNPSEPRVYEYHADAHQFTKHVSDYGWTRFTRYARREFPFRSHGKRQAILRNDQLAFSAYIRIVNDPTGCLWSHGVNPFEDSIALTGLRPFSPQFPWFAAQLPLLHFAPFRDFITRCRDTKIVFWFQTLLWKMMSRKRSGHYSQPDEYVQSDTIAWLRFAVRWLRRETSAEVVNDLVGSLDPQRGAAVGGNRLKTKNVGSVQAAIDAHSTALDKPALLTLELERHEFDKKERKWKKITNKVDMDDKISVGGTSYTLFAFATHCGDLESNKFNLYIRPNGPLHAWYAYTNRSVSCVTRKQCVEKYCGVDEHSEPLKKKRHSTPRSIASHHGFSGFEERDEVAHVVIYVRKDCERSAFSSITEEPWEVPENVRRGIPPKFDGVEDQPPATAVYERFSESVSNDPHPPDEEDVRRSSFQCDAGYATPNCWQMDGDDVVMSDADDDSIDGNTNTLCGETSLDEHLSTHTIDHLGREYYEGQMLGHKYHGEGHLIAMNGDEYVGHFQDGQKSGHGRMTYASTGNIYEGDWASDEHHGQGKLTEVSTGNIFEGGWNQGKKHGRFVLKGTVTDEDKGCCSICYDREITTAFYDCGHVIACKDCAHKIDNCPVCRKRVLARLELFGVKMSFE